MKRFVMLLGVLLVSLSASAALSIDDYRTDIHLAFGKAVVETTMTFDGEADGELKIGLPEDAEKISLYIDGSRVKPKKRGDDLIIPLNGSEDVRLNYISDALVDKTMFLVTMTMPEDTARATITLTLPEKAVLARPLSDKEVSGESVFPKPAAATTDGKSIILAWEWKGLRKGEDISLFVDYAYNGTGGWTVALLALIGAGVLGLLLWRKKKGQRARRSPSRTTKAAPRPPPQRSAERPVDNPLVEPRPKPIIVDSALPMEKYLKEDEEQVVNILKQRDGSCEQGTLRVITGFSKAKLSGLLKELEERNVIYKEKRGKRNLVFLKEQKMNGTEPSPPQPGSDER